MQLKTSQKRGKRKEETRECLSFEQKSFRIYSLVFYGLRRWRLNFRVDNVSKPNIYAWRQILVQIDKMVSWRLIKREILRVPMILISLFYPAMFSPNKGIDFLFCWL